MKTFIFSTNFLLTLILSLPLALCSKDDSEDDNEQAEKEITEEKGTMTFTVNGENRISDTPWAAFLEIVSQDSTLYGFGISAGYVNDDLETWGVSTSFNSQDPELFKEGTSISSGDLNTNEILVAGTYHEGLVRIPEDEVLLDTKYEQGEFYTIIIDEVNETDQTATGRFEIDLIDSVSGSSYRIRNGVFKNARMTRERLVLEN